MNKAIEIINTLPVQSIRSNHSSLIEQLFDLIRDGKVEDVEDIANILYAKKEVSNVAIYALLKRLEQKVIDATITQPEIKSDFNAVYTELLKISCVADLLSNTGKKKQATYFAEKAIKKAMLFELTTIALSLANICKSYYSIAGNTKKYLYYTELSGRLLDQFVAEKKAEDLHFQLFHTQAKRKTITNDDISGVKSIFEELCDIKRQQGNNRIQLIWGICGVILYQLQEEPSKSIQICKECLNVFIPQKEYLSISYIFTFLFHLIPDMVKQKEYEEALHYINQCEKITSKQPYNSVLVQQYKFIVGMHSQNFQAAKESLSARQGLKLNAQQTEILQIHEAYYLLLSNQALRLGRLFNQVPIFSQDKEGMNLNILFIQLCYMIREGNFMAFVDRTPGISRYLIRHLKRSKDKRSRYFLESLLALEKIDFDLQKLDQVKAFKKFQTYSYEESMKSFELEIVPYEYLWEMVGEWLD